MSEKVVSGTQAATPEQNQATALKSAATVFPDGYEKHEIVGRGGMGIVYRARDTALDREVAVKLLQDQFDAASEFGTKFVQEARISAQLQHPGIPAVYAVGTTATGRPYLAMKLIKGRTLANLLPTSDRGHLVAIFEAIAQAIGYAHSRRVIHRDLKPANVMVGAFGEVQVMDWGLAKVLADGPVTADAQSSTGTHIRSPRSADSDTRYGDFMGTPAYMPPEQAIGAVDKINERSDVFGLGGILCAILTGHPPFVGDAAETTRQMAAQGKVGEAFARLDASGAEPELIALAKCCLAVDQDERPANGDAVAKIVAKLRQDADERAKLALVAKAASDMRRRVLTWGAAIVVTVLTAGTMVSMVQANRAKEAERETAKQLLLTQAEEKRAIAAEKATGEQLVQTQVAEAEANSVVTFFEDKVLAAARPKGQDGGLGSGVSLHDALVSNLPALDTDFTNQPLVEARLRRTLGSTFLHLGDANRAAHQYEKTSALHVKHLGPDHPETLRTRTNLAVSYGEIGRKADAIPILEETLSAQRRVLSPDHPNTLRTMHNLAAGYAALGRSADALRLCEQTVAAQRRVLPPDHPDTLASMLNLAGNYVALGRSVDALRLCEQTVAAQQRVLPPDHPITLRGMTLLADIYESLGRNADALVLREKTLVARRRVLPPDHLSTIRNMGNLAKSYADLGRQTEALKLQEETLAAFKRVLPPEHSDTLQSMVNMAYYYTALGRHSDALKLRGETLSVYKRTLPPNHPDTLACMWDIASSLVALDRGSEAISFIDECVAKADGKAVDPQMLLGIMALRREHFQKAGDPAGCRATAEMWEKLNRTDSDSMYEATCHRAVTAAVQAKQKGADAARLAAEDADKAMAWLTKAVTTGFKDVAHMKKDSDLDTLRTRADFRKLLTDLEAKDDLTQRELLVSFYKSGTASQKLEDYVVAIAWYEKALAVAAKFERPEYFAKEVKILKGRIGDCKANLPPPKRREVAPPPRAQP